MKEMTALAPFTMMVTVTAPPEKCTWYGLVDLSCLSSLSFFFAEFKPIRLVLRTDTLSYCCQSKKIGNIAAEPNDGFSDIGVDREMTGAEQDEETLVQQE